MIRFWKFSDSLKLFKLIRAFLESQEKLGWDVEISHENILWYWNLAMTQIAQGDPHLVWEEDGEILSYIQMGERCLPLKLKKKTAEIFAMYTVPKARDRFLSIELIREAGARIAELGYTSIYSTVFAQNRKMIENMFFNPAIWPSRVILEWRLEHDPQFENAKIARLTERIAK